LTDKKSSC